MDDYYAPEPDEPGALAIEPAKHNALIGGSARARREAARPYPSACHSWLHVASDERGRTYRCVACGESLVLPREGTGDAR